MYTGPSVPKQFDNLNSITDIILQSLIVFENNNVIT